jgi:hypothetical protein
MTALVPDKIQKYYVLVEGMSNSSANTETQLLQLLPSRIRVVQQFFPLNWEARSWYYRCFSELVANGILDLEHACYSDEELAYIK